MSLRAYRTVGREFVERFRPLRLGGARPKQQAESQYKPNPPHRHLDREWLAGSLAERHDAHQHGAAWVMGQFDFGTAGRFSSVFLALRRHRITQSPCLLGQPLDRW